MACPFDTRITEKEREKIDHYQDLKVEIQKAVELQFKRICCSSCNWGTWGGDRKLGDVVYLDRNTCDPELTPKSLLVGNSKDLKKDSRHLRL